MSNRNKSGNRRLRMSVLAVAVSVALFNLSKANAATVKISSSADLASLTRLDSPVNYYGNSDTRDASNAVFNLIGNSATENGNQIFGFGNNIFAGGYAESGSASFNSLNVSSVNGNETVYEATLYGGYACAQADTYNSVSSNLVTLTMDGNDAFSGTIYGGYSEDRYNEDAEVSLNTVQINANTAASGTTLTVYGGGVADGTNDALADVSYNTVILTDELDLSNANLYGTNAVTITGHNTLQFGTSDITFYSSNYINTVANFDIVKAVNVTWGNTIKILSFSNDYALNKTTTFEASQVAFASNETTTALSVGDSYTMFTVNGASSHNITVTSASTYTVGTTLQGTGKLAFDETGENIVYTITDGSDSEGSGSESAPDTYGSESAPDTSGSESDPDTSGSESDPDTSGDQPDAGDAGTIVNTKHPTVQEQTHTTAMVASAGAAALIEGANTTSMAGFNLATSGVLGLQVFSAVGGGTSRIDTGSYVRLNSINYTIGIGTNIPAPGFGLWSVGVAFEGGYGKFKNHYDAGNAEGYISKDGHVNYFGGVLLGNVTLESLWHFNAALRFGHMSSHQSNALYDWSSGSNYNVDIDSAYFGAEFGAGRILKLSDSLDADLYGKFFYLYQDSDDFYAGGNYQLNSVKSVRTRLGGRFDWKFAPAATLYAGLAWEQEFDGEATVTADGAEVEPSESDGARAFAETGIRLVPENGRGLHLDLGVKGQYGSDYRGIFGQLKAKYVF